MLEKPKLDGSVLTNRLIPLRSEQLEPGMYVAELDRSWLHTPFTGPGFLITQRSQLHALRRQCNYVYVDPSRSEAGTVGTPPGAVPIRSVSKKAKGNGAGLHEVRTSLRSMLERITATVQSARRDGQLNLQMIKPL